MPATRVVYDDGEETEVDLRISHLIKAERKLETSTTLEASMYATWLALGKPDAKFDQWLDRVERVEQAEENGSPLPGESPD